MAAPRGGRGCGRRAPLRSLRRPACPFGRTWPGTAGRGAARARRPSHGPPRPRHEAVSGKAARVVRSVARRTLRHHRCVACPEQGSSGRMGTPSQTAAQTTACVEGGWGTAHPSSQGFHIVIHRCPSRLDSAPPDHVSSVPGNSREQSCACGTAQWRGLRGAGSSGGPPGESPGGGKCGRPDRRLVTRVPVCGDATEPPPGALATQPFLPLLSPSSPHPLSFGHDSRRNRCFRGPPGVAG